MERPSMAGAKRARLSPDSESFSSDASTVAAVIASRFAAALSRVPYLAAMISPCSVMRMRPRTVPCGWARTAATAAAPHGAPATVKYLHRRAESLEYRRERTGGLVQAPYRGQVTAILVRIGISDHHLLKAMRRRDGQGLRQLEPCRHHVGGLGQIADGFEQRHRHDRCARIGIAAVKPRLLEQDIHFQQVRHALALGHDVRGNAAAAIAPM